MIKIKKITRMEDFKKIPEIQKSAWGFMDLDVEPHHLMTRVQKYGGLIQGLFLNNILVGFTYAIIGKYKNNIFIYSHMTAVEEEHQGKGFGFMLKKAQREEVLKMGYQIIIWNFDPLESLNSFFNLHRLGVISKEYERNVYGVGDKGLFKGLPTDRLIAYWDLKSDLVKKKMESSEPKIIKTIGEDNIEKFTGSTAYIEIPRNIRLLKQQNFEEAFHWRMKTRESFELAFLHGFEAENIIFSKDNQKIFYELTKRGEPNG